MCLAVMKKMRVTSTPLKGRYSNRLPDPEESNKVNRWYDKGSSLLEPIEQIECCL